MSWFWLKIIGAIIFIIVPGFSIFDNFRKHPYLSIASLFFGIFLLYLSLSPFFNNNLEKKNVVEPIEYEINNEDAKKNIKDLSDIIVNSCPSEPNTSGLNLIVEQASRALFSGVFLLCKNGNMGSSSKNQDKVIKIHKYIATLEDSKIVNLIMYIKKIKWLPHGFISYRVNLLKKEIDSIPYISGLHSGYRNSTKYKINRNKYGRIIYPEELLTGSPEYRNGNNATLVQKFIFRQGDIITKKIVLALNTYLIKSNNKKAELRNISLKKYNKYYTSCLNKIENIYYSNRVSFDSYKEFIESTGWITSHDLYGLVPDEKEKIEPCERDFLKWGHKQDVTGINNFSAIAYTEWLSEIIGKKFIVPTSDELFIISKDEKPANYTSVNHAYIGGSITDINDKKFSKKHGNIFDTYGAFSVKAEVHSDFNDWGIFQNDYYYNGATGYITFRTILKK